MPVGGKDYLVVCGGFPPTPWAGPTHPPHPPARREPWVVMFRLIHVEPAGVRPSCVTAALPPPHAHFPCEREKGNVLTTLSPRSSEPCRDDHVTVRGSPTSRVLTGPSLLPWSFLLSHPFWSAGTTVVDNGARSSMASFSDILPLVRQRRCAR